MWNTVKNQTDSFISEKALLQKGDKIVVGFSGGADSTALLHYLKSGGYEVIACHLNHLLRGEESDRDEAFCREFAKSLGVPFEVKRVDVSSLSKKRKQSAEETGRNERYAFFEETRLRYNADKIATAHTLSDNAETVVFNLARGSGAKGLCGIPPTRGRIVRPLLSVTRAEVEAYCEEQGLSYVTDSTNLKDDYTRNKIRHSVIPTLLEINGGFLRSFLRMNEILSEENLFLENLSRDIFEALYQNEALETEKLKLQEKAVRRRVLSIFLEENGLKRDFYFIDRLDEMINSENARLNISGKLFAEHRQNKLRITALEEAPSPLSFEIKEGETVSFFGDSFKITAFERKNCGSDEKINKMLLYIDLDYDKIKGQATLRTKIDGDRLCCKNRGGTKSLKKIFIEKKLSQNEKLRQAVIADEEGVIALFGYDVDRRAAVTDETKKILRIEKQNSKK